MKRNEHNIEAQMTKYSRCTQRKQKHVQKDSLTYTQDYVFSETQQILLKFDGDYFSEEYAVYTVQEYDDSIQKRCTHYLHTKWRNIYEDKFWLTNETCCIASILSTHRHAAIPRELFPQKIHTLHTLFDRNRQYCLCEAKKQKLVVLSLWEQIGMQFTLIQEMRNLNILQHKRMKDNAIIATRPESVNSMHIILARSLYSGAECATINMLEVHDNKLKSFKMGPVLRQNVTKLQYIACQPFMRHTNTYIADRPLRKNDMTSQNGIYDKQAYILIPPKTSVIQLRLHAETHINAEPITNVLNIYIVGTVTTMLALALHTVLQNTRRGRNIVQRISHIIESVKWSLTRRH